MNTKSNESPAPTGHPPAFWFIFWGEFAERCSYYGMRAILPLYLTSILHYSVKDANPIYFRFKMAVYLLPLLGGYLADRFTGKYWALVGFSVPYVLGHFILGIENTAAMVIALGLLAIGSGVTKPNISALLGQTYDQKRPGQEQLLSSAFRWFYFSINIGALLSQFALPFVRDSYGYKAAFQFPAWLMVGALIVFAAGKRFYAVETPGRIETTPEQRRQQWQTLKTLFGVFSIVIFFWFAYEHNDVLWVYFTRDYVNRQVPGIQGLIESVGRLEDGPLGFLAIRLKPGLQTVAANGIAPDQFQFINALSVLIFIPVVTLLFKFLDPRQRIFTAANRMLIGFLVTAAATGIMTAAGILADRGARDLSMFWIVSAYIVLTLGEVLVYATGLELSYTAAPKSMKSFITACFLVTNMLANTINMFFTPLYGGDLEVEPAKRGLLPPGQFFGLTMLIVLVATVAFYFVSRQLTRRIAEQKLQDQAAAA